MTTFENIKGSKPSINYLLPANRVPGPRQGNWAYDDYAALPDDGRRYEIMDGVLIMAPSPTPEHQEVNIMLGHYLILAIKNRGLGKVFVAPIDVELTPKKIVQPDVLVILNANLASIQKKKIVGAPDLVVEIASPGTALYDRLDKYKAYQKAGVSEYWLADPDAQTVEVFVLEQGMYQPLGLFQGQDTIPSRVAPAMVDIRVEQFFA